jgi:hypothetical protein
MITRLDERPAIPEDVHGEPHRRLLEATIIGSYREMPGLSLHLAQASRLFGLRTTTCKIVLEGLVQRGHLRRAHDGQYRRNF